ncbi:MAG TPA: NADPH-dependent 7-cyano-7-deazaguanine reductase QueF [Cellvibrio sp.]|nr:NADPH-dependent 7-cyano-7-deazaguanine reductase QueF [Cellvibrio sp.]
MPSLDSSPLGQKTAYISQYQPSLLFPIARQESREQLGLGVDLPFYGVDIWTGYELSWLNALGKPQVAVAEFAIPCSSPFIIESKSFKLYLNSLNQTRFNSFAEVEACLVRDLSQVAGAAVGVDLQSLEESALLISRAEESHCLDELNIDVASYHPQPSLLTLDHGEVSEKLCSHLLKTNCPVTGQPDWASLFIGYTGQKINHENLLRYIISFREHQDFHEHCVERIFTDILQRCQPQSLTVYARYTRRGGLDINPFRSSEQGNVPEIGRILRQ